MNDTAFNKLRQKMKKGRSLLYINSDYRNCDFIFSGINFNEFLRFTDKKIDNLILLHNGLSPETEGNNFERCFELYEGQEHISELAKNDIYDLGDFCFIDYESIGYPKKLSEEQIAELLYLGHRFMPLKSPFFRELNNKFAYLSHDDGFFCRLFCRERDEFTRIAVKKIIDTVKERLNTVIAFQDHGLIADFSENGLLIDFDELYANGKNTILNLYSIGKYTDMNDVINNKDKLKLNAKAVKQIII